MSKKHQTVLILDYGSQVTKLIARRIREANVYCEIHPFNFPTEKIIELSPNAIVLSGGPQSAYTKGAPQLNKNILNLGVPILGICYGYNLLGMEFGGKVERAEKREYGRADLKVLKKDDLFFNVSDVTQVWMSHGDYISSLPEGFEIIGKTDNAPYAAIRNLNKKIYGIQFHPEVIHTSEGEQILRNFLFKISTLKGDWTSKSFIREAIEKIREKADSGKVVCALSGGVDSSVTAVLMNKAIGERLVCIFVDNGLLRKGEKEQVKSTFREYFKMNLITVEAEERFLSKLRNVTDPEQKRKIIGNEFISIFEEQAKKIPGVEFLAQGTLYPDLIESVSFRGPSARIKSHHNVGGLPEVMNLKLIEPLKELFKDEVREVGKELTLPHSIIRRHPFPGPGLAIRILGDVTKEKLNTLREVDDIFISEIKKNGLYDEIWQALCVLLPVKSVGVMGDDRTYENVVALRAVTSKDGMTADWYKMPYEVLGRISNRIINEISGVNRVVYDISSKPPSTIEWE